MAAEQHTAIQDARRLARLAGQQRAESIRQQVAAAEVIILLANTELEQGRVQQATSIGEKMRKLAEKVRGHLNEPRHVPSTDAAELRARLEHMESGIRALVKGIHALRSVPE